ncbi:MAG: sensor histidine kinase [Candidatus Ozemobacteraceae bacterium]
MTQSWQDTLSARMLALKSQLGNIIELVDSWVLSLGQEEERVKNLSELWMILENPGNGLHDEDRKSALGLVAGLVGRGDALDYSSSSFRLKLQNMFRVAMEKMNCELDDLLKQVGKLRDLSAKGVEPNGGFILAQEDERKRISREIHDGPAQNLASLTMRIDFCLENIHQEGLLQKELVELKDSVARCLKDIRRFIFDLRPMALDDLGLVPTLEQFISGFQTRTGLVVQFHREGDAVALSPENELAAFRVIQEAVNNAHRHARAKMVRIFLTFDQEKRSVTVAITDDGSGFDLPAVRKAYPTLKKLGLLSMEERVRLAGGDFSLVSAIGEGTVVTFTLFK